MATRLDSDLLHLEEQLVRIRKMVEESDKTRAEQIKITLETRLAPWQLTLGALTAGAALFAAGAAFVKLFG